MRTRMQRIVWAFPSLMMLGCASTAIERGPDGFRYYSDKNVAVEGLEIERRLPDGTVEKIKVAKAGGDAASVNAQWAGLMGELVRRIPAAGVVTAPPEDPMTAKLWRERAPLPPDTRTGSVN